MLQIPVSENLVLQTYSPDHAGVLFKAIEKNRAYLRPWLAWVDHSIKEEHSLEFIHTMQVQMQQQAGLALGIFFKEQLIGGIGMHDWDHQLQKAEVGYWLDKDHQQRGYKKSMCQWCWYTFFIKYGYQGLSNT